MLKTLSKISLVALTFVLSPFVQANNFSYNYFEFRSGFGPQTIGGEVSMMLMENAHFVGRVDSRFDNDWDAAVGVGFNGPIGAFADIYGQILLHHVNFVDSSSSSSEFQPEFNLGGRVWLANQIEVLGRIGLHDERSVFHAGVNFHSTEALVLFAGARNDGVYGPQFSIAARFNY
ncbi:hypothetical protein [Vibrio genomosp. F10]|uniref:Outer membrane protein beta-barrel domain-containing protein n=2 Tax=Vibrio genomosp. F10 TaxID=723171 RepID=A0A1B9R2Q7_9VIBR|nr:hypothetical protein [Vibrio genomosp. F10]OCH78570.1 hypothetical protein A6E14_17280 [Vibrio genomosp. F10]OEE31393.1 hypothetical protein A1QO_13820 [Vibrio genomosp. F10 str. ZF-129]OEE95107.1 hypothetical protein A1QM_05470 [Vibrio genomosp. F10 str. 9ZC157]OEF09032.1 hypothetical protein A1QK_05950 [Vibrio genomosp. F10 str. 9ZD137]OEF10557.1 hypothetical protein A1QI_00200 [Vibrio genomosp. F10 str. 9ZB36]